MFTDRISKSVKTVLTASINKDAPVKGISTTPDEHITELADNRLNSRIAADSVRIAVLNRSLHRGIGAVFDNCEAFAQRGVDLSKTYDLVKFYRDTYETRVNAPVLAGQWELLASRLDYLRKFLEEEKPEAGLFFHETAEQICKDPKQVSFLAVMDAILAHWDPLCSCDDTYVVLAVMANIIEYLMGTTHKDLLAFLQTLEVSSQDWPD